MSFDTFDTSSLCLRKAERLDERTFETYQIFNTLLDLATPVLDAILTIPLIRQLIHAHTSAKPSVLAEQLLERRTGPLGRTRRRVRCLIFFDVFQNLDRRWRAGKGSTAREGGRGVGILAAPCIIIASNTLESLADSKIVVFGRMKAKVNVSFGLRMRHARRFVALVVPMFRWRLWSLSRSCANFPRLRIIKIFHLSVALVGERIELRNATV